MSRNKITINSVTEDLHDARIPETLGTVETWTFTLDDDTIVTKEVVAWTSQE